MEQSVIKAYINMDLIFNELTVTPLAGNKTDAYKRILQLLQTFKKANTTGFRKIRFDQNFSEIKLYEGYSIQDYLNEPANRIHKTLLLGLYRYPYLQENTETENSYLEKNFFITAAGQNKQCHSLAAAYLEELPESDF